LQSPRRWRRSCLLADRICGICFQRQSNRFELGQSGRQSSTISRAITSGAGRLSRSSSDSSFNNVMSRFAFSRATISSYVNDFRRWPSSRSARVAGVLHAVTGSSRSGRRRGVLLEREVLVGALRLGPDHAHHALVDVQQVVSAPVSGLHHRFAQRQALMVDEVERLAVLHRPAGLSELAVMSTRARCSAARRSVASSGLITGQIRADSCCL
jgi:hypothetical protein